jgi:hypothetical protein
MASESNKSAQQASGAEPSKSETLGTTGKSTESGQSGPQGETDPYPSWTSRPSHLRSEVKSESSTRSQHGSKSKINYSSGKEKGNEPGRDLARNNLEAYDRSRPIDDDEDFEWPT